MYVLPRVYGLLVTIADKVECETVEMFLLLVPLDITFLEVILIKI